MFVYLFVYVHEWLSGCFIHGCVCLCVYVCVLRCGDVLFMGCLWVQQGYAVLVLCMLDLMTDRPAVDIRPFVFQTEQVLFSESFHWCTSARSMYYVILINIHMQLLSEILLLW